MSTHPLKCLFTAELHEAALHHLEKSVCKKPSTPLQKSLIEHLTHRRRRSCFLDIYICFSILKCACQMETDSCVHEIHVF